MCCFLCLGGLLPSLLLFLAPPSPPTGLAKSSSSREAPDLPSQPFPDQPQPWSFSSYCILSCFPFLAFITAVIKCVNACWVFVSSSKQTFVLFTDVQAAPTSKRGCMVAFTKSLSKWCFVSGLFQRMLWLCESFKGQYKIVHKCIEGLLYSNNSINFSILCNFISCCMHLLYSYMLCLLSNCTTIFGVIYM